MRKVKVDISYLSDHPTNFNWNPRVKERVALIQRRHPWKTFINTYWDHPPDFHTPRLWPVDFYSKKSFDVWGGGGNSQATYSGYRGKPLPQELGKRIFHEIFNASGGPPIDWCIYRGKMYWSPKTGGSGWTASPAGPADSDPGHWQHIHVTYQV